MNSPELILENRLQHSYDKKLKHKSKKGGNILISEPYDFYIQYIDGYDSDPELISKKEYEKMKKSKINNIQTIKYKENNIEDENRINRIQMMNNSKDTINNKNKGNREIKSINKKSG